MIQRLNPYKASPNGVAALVGVEKYIEACGLDHRLIALVTDIAATHAPDDVYDEARRQFSEKELADLSIVVAMINAWNRLSIGARSVHPADHAKAA